MEEHKDIKYTMEESAGMVHEPAVDYATTPRFRYDEAMGHHVNMTFDFQQDDTEYDDSPLPDISSYEEAIALGGVDIEVFSKEMHEYIDELCDEYNIR